MSFKIGKNCKIHPSAVINVHQGEIGEGSIISENARLEGSKIVIGREAFIDRGATIGGGSCFDPQAELITGDWLHMGVNSHINTARGVYVGHEFGCGIDTKIFTHGAYIDSYNLGAPAQWKPVHIGNNVWMPNAWVNPGVKIGSNVVIAARSLLNTDLPDNCLAAGSPAKIITENYLPNTVNFLELVGQIIDQAQLRFQQINTILKPLLNYNSDKHEITVQSEKNETVFNLKEKIITGNELLFSLTLKDQLRRNGIRFRYEITDKLWTAWTK